MTELKSRTLNGIGWSAIERLSVQSVTFIIQIILARLLTPEDYGIIGMLTIFIQLSQVLVDSGFANALIQKQDCTERDYSTVFYTNLLISLFLYLVLFIAAPTIASFYNEITLVNLTRILAIIIFINAIPIVPRTILTKNVDFKSLSYVSFISTIISGVIGIVLAYQGYGVWALVSQQLSNGLLQCFVLFFITKWMPKAKFCRHSFKGLFGFGSKILASSIISSIYKNLYTIVIGKCCTTKDLGYFTRAEQIAMFPSSNLSNIIARVAYPIFSSMQNDNALLSSAYRKMIRYSSIVIFPLMSSLIVLSKPLIIVLLSERWVEMTIILQLLSIDWMLDHLSVLNLNLLYVKGRSDLALRLEIIKKVIATVLLIISIPYGIMGICYGRIFYSVLATFINSYYTKSLIGLSLFQQLSDISPSLINSIIMGICIYAITFVLHNNILLLLLGPLLGAIIYMITTYFISKDIFIEIKGYIKL